ncbi:MAG: sodium:calcium antiporter [Gammaproteobacteria bacterium]|jgi:cation:H+ antiporter
MSMIENIELLPLPALFAIVVLSAVVIGVAGTRLVFVVESISQKSGLGDAISGALFIGIATSLSGSVLSMTAANEGHTGLAISNATGGIVVQTFFLVIGDLLYRGTNIEHAAASLENTMQAALSILLMTAVLFFHFGPDLTLFGIHPGSVVLIAIYITGLYVIRQSHEDPQWFARRSPQTRDDESREPIADESPGKLLTRFTLLALLLVATGLLLTRTTEALSAQTGISESVLGALLTSTLTSLPELVTMITAIRRGALTLAIGNIIGGNTFDVLFLSASDVAYRDGSLFHTMTGQHLLIVVTAIGMTAILTLGLLRREKTGPASIGLEGVAVACVFVLFVAVLLTMD